MITCVSGWGYGYEVFNANVGSFLSNPVHLRYGLGGVVGSVLVAIRARGSGWIGVGAGLGVGLGSSS